MDARQLTVFFELHSGIPRQGPGSRESTRKAFSLIGKLPGRPMLADIGCGPGQQTLHLAEMTNGTIVAVDLFAVYLRELKETFAGSPLFRKVSPVRGDMAALPFRNGVFDAIWSEGAIYILGFEAGLKDCRVLLKAAGYLAVTEVAWLKENPPARVHRFWDEAYPAMQTVGGNLRIARRCGYRILGHFVLPQEAWWNDYYRCLEKKMAILRRRYREDFAALQVLDLEQAEIDLYRECHDIYGYVFYVLQKT